MMKMRLMMPAKMTVTMLFSNAVYVFLCELFFVVARCCRMLCICANVQKFRKE